MIVEAVKVEIYQKDKSQSEEWNRLWTEEFASHKYNFNRQNENLAMLPKITLKEFQAYFEKVLVGKTHRRLDICYNSKVHLEQEAKWSKKVAHAHYFTKGSTLKNTVDLFADPIHEGYVNYGKQKRTPPVPPKERTFIMIKPDGV